MYQTEWNKSRPLEVYIRKAIDTNRFVLKPEGFITKSHTIKDLADMMFQSNWQASDLYPWLEEFCPNYFVERTYTRTDVVVTFDNTKHAVLFKLTWCGS